MSSPHPVPAETAEPAGGAVAAPAARPPASPWTEVRHDLRTAGVVVAVLAVAGLASGVLWWLLAPRADFRITSGGPSPIGNPSEELLAADDVVFVLVLAGLGLVAGIVVWFRRSFRGVAAIGALAVGMAAAGSGAWLIGRLLAPAPGHAALTHVGGVVRTGLDLASWPALAVGPFLAVLAYVLATVVDSTDDLGRAAAGDEGDRPPSGAPR